MRSLLAVTAAAGAVLSHASGPGGTAAGRVQTLYTHRGSIAAFAQDGSDVAWFAPGGAKCDTVHLLSLRNGLNISLPSQATRNVTCHFIRTETAPVRLALAHTSGEALWTLPQRSPLVLDYVVGAGVAPRERKERPFLEVAHTARGVGLWLGGIAGSGDTLVFGVTTVDYRDEAGCLARTAPCTLVEAGGGIYRIAGRSRTRVPNTSAAVDVAAAGSTIAYIPTASIGRNGRPLPSARFSIPILDARSGISTAHIRPRGVPLAIALAPHILAALERTPLGMRVAWYDRRTGAPRGSVPVPAATARSVTANDQLIVFRVGRSLRSVSLARHNVHVLARAAATPLGLSLAGGRLAWAENVGRSWRIRALYVTGRG